jgi:membrane protein
VLAAIAWIVSSALLSWYLANSGNYDATYGSLGAAIGLMVWRLILAGHYTCSFAAGSQIGADRIRHAAI